MSQQSAEQRTTTVVASAFALSMIGAAAAAIVYVLGEDALAGSFTQAFGLALAVAIGSLGVGLVAWAHGLMPAGPDVEEREFSAPHPEERDEALETYESGREGIGRRGLLGRMLAAALGATGLATLLPIRSFADDPFPERALTGWREGIRVVTEDGEPIKASEVAFNTALTVFPEGSVSESDSQVMLVRVPPGLFQPEPGREDWAPEGLVAYSKLCTHLGCPVGLYQTETQWLLCPCHQSAFDVLDAARPRFGPATRPLPQLPLTIDDQGFVRAQSDFDRPVGPGFWTWPSLVGEDDPS